MATTRGALVSAVLLAVALDGGAQTTPAPLDWRHIGNSVVDFSAAGAAGGPVNRVWYSPDGAELFIRSGSGRVFETSDFEKWIPSNAVPPAPERNAASDTAPEHGALIRASTQSGRVYAAGEYAYRSDDGGRSWMNLTTFHGQSILGGALRDLAVSPVNPDEITAASDFGVWRSMDGGLSWSGLNEALPNLPVRRLLQLPAGTRGTRILLDGIGEAEWKPGERVAWRRTAASDAAQDQALKQALSTVLGARISAYALAGDSVYAGSMDGRLWVSEDRGGTWSLPYTSGGGPVESIFAAATDPSLALAALGGGAGSPHVLRTVNAGGFWDDISSNLPDVPAHGVAADPPSGAVYAATDLGVFYTYSDLNGPGPATLWISLTRNLAGTAARDVKLDAASNQLYVALDGYGIYATLAPHRLRQLRVVNSADFSNRPAAPGSLLSVLGGRVETARLGDRGVPVLDANNTESQLQVPFEATGTAVSLALNAGGVSTTVGVALQMVSPAIFVSNADGTPMLLDADTGVMLDSTNPAHAGARIQILATGLGKVRPDWPTGMPAPIESPPSVIASLKVYLDQSPVAVTRATLAPGYVGFYVVEVQLPDVVNSGPAELYLEAGGQQSNPVLLYLEQ